MGYRPERSPKVATSLVGNALKATGYDPCGVKFGDGYAGLDLPVA